MIRNARENQLLPWPHSVEIIFQGYLLAHFLSANRRYAGHRYGLPDDDSIILIFDAAGYIAGAQSVVPADKVDPNTMALQPVYQVQLLNVNLTP